PNPRSPVPGPQPQDTDLSNGEVRTETRSRRSRRRPSELTVEWYGPVLFRRNQQQQSDAADDGEGRTVIEHGRMADPIPKQPGNDAGHELQQAHGGAVPADPAGAQMLRHEVRCKGLADGAENPLIQS